MARMARLYVPGCSHHVIQRGNNRCSCFRDRSDFLSYLEYLTEASNEHCVAIHAYVLMTNHVHLLLTPCSAESCGKMMQCLGRRYVRRFNDRYKRTGTLWEGRYKSTLVDSDNYFFTVSRYIELNPVRANIVTDPAQYPWSSFRSNAQGSPSDLLVPHGLYERLGTTREERQQRYSKFFDEDLSADVLEELRHATNHSWAFGSEDFLNRISPMANRRPESRGRGGDRRRGQGV